MQRMGQGSQPSNCQVSTTLQGQLKQGTELYRDSAKAQNQALILNRSISIDLEKKVRSTNKIINVNIT